MVVEAGVMKIFGFWSSVLVLKILGMLLLTARYRFRNKVFANPDDTQFVKGGKVSYTDPDVERVRRSHRNDLESILPWFIITFIWLQTGPPEFFAGLLIRTFVLSRIGHTLFYAVFPQQPLRAITFLIGTLVTLYETLSTMLYYL